MALSPGQYYSIVLVTIVTSLLSVIGSTFVAVASKQASKKSIYQRLVLGLSIGDAISSFSFILHPFMLPREMRDYGLLWASGNSTTCAIIGFIFVSAPVTVSFYSMYISLYFYLKVAHNYSDTKLERSFEIPARYLAVFLPLTIAILGAASGAFAPRVYHNVCSFGDCEIGKVNATCDEEKGWEWWVGWSQALLVILPGLAALIFTVLVYCSVRSRLRAGNRFSFGNHDSVQKKQHMAAVRTQAILYAMAYWNSFFWLLMFGAVAQDDESLAEKEGSTGLFVLQIIFWIFYPLQGLINLLVYSRPRYLQWRKSNPNKSSLYCWRKAISFKPVKATAHIPESSATITSEVAASTTSAGLVGGQGIAMAAAEQSLEEAPDSPTRIVASP